MFSDRIKELRNKAMLNQKDFGATIGAALSSISKYEKGTAIPKKKVIDKICQVYGVDEDWLFGEEQDAVSEVQESITEDFESVSTLEEEYIDEVEESVIVEELKEEAEADSGTPEAEAGNDAVSSDIVIVDEMSAEPEMVDIELTDDSTLDFDEIKIESFDGKQIEMYDLLRKVKLADPDAMSVYIKPEENKAYYVTKSTTGSVDIW